MFGYKKVKELEEYIKQLKDSIETIAKTVPEVRVLLGEFPIKTLDLNAKYVNLDTGFNVNRIIVKTPTNKYKILAVTRIGDLETSILELFNNEKEVLEHLNNHNYIKLTE